MRIWHLTKSLSGGAGQYALRLSNAMGEFGIESTVLVAEGPIADGALLLARVASPIRRFGARAMRSLSHRIAEGPYHSLHSPEFYDAPQPFQTGDIVHLHGMTGWIGVPGLRRLIPQGAKVFWTAHDLWIVSGGCVVYQGCNQFRRQCADCPILRAPWKGVARYELRTKQAFINSYQVHPIANSEWMAARIRESGMFGHLTSIPIVTPIVEAAYLNPTIPDLRREMGIPEARKVICLGARSLTDRFKGIAEFLDHVSQAPDLANQLTILLFGPGTIEVPANLDVRMLGSITDPSELAKIYRASEAFVSPSLMETFGMTLAEAQGCGTPAVSFSVGGTPETLRDGQTGWLVPCGDFPALIALLRSVLAAPEELTKAGQAAHDWVAATFCTDRIARQILTVYGLDPK
jgi:glycosyltransferase involved in cell wall biosynthesis